MGKEDKQKQPEPSFSRHMLAAMIGCTNGILNGLNIGFTSVGLDSLQVEGEKGIGPFRLTDRQIVKFGSYMNLASMMGALLLSGYIAQKFGRKWPNILTVLPYTLGWALIAFPKNYTMLLIGQVICGLSTGLRAPIGRMYMAEVSHRKYRGEFLTSITTLVMASSLVSYVLALFLNWQQLAIFSGILPLVMVPVMIYLPESHVWLITKNRHQEAKEAWKWFNGEAYVEAVGDKEFEDCITHYEETKEAVKSWRDIMQFSYLKPVFIIVVCLLLRHFCGNTAIMFFMSQIFKMSKSGLEPRYAVIVLGSIQLFFIIISGKMMDRIGRRKSTVISSIIMGVSLIGMGTYFFLDENPKSRHLAEMMNWMPLLFLSTCMIGYSLGIASIAIILSGEIVPIQIKNQTNGIINFFNKGFAYVALEAFHLTIEVMNPSGTFWMYAACSFILAAFFLIVLPETKGQTLYDIERRLTQGSIVPLGSAASYGSMSSVRTTTMSCGGLSLPTTLVEDEKSEIKKVSSCKGLVAIEHINTKA